MSPSPKDQDCAFLARQALFPWQVNRDGSHQTLHPALEALQTVRDAAIAAHPERSASSFFPSRVVVVRATAGVDGELTWNGQPDISANDASFTVIPKFLSVKCQDCSKLETTYEKAFVVASSSSSSADKETEIILCTDRVMKKDYVHGRIQDLPPKSLAAVEEALAHAIIRHATAATTLSNNDNTTIEEEQVAKAEILAARAAECYYGKEGAVRKGSALGPSGYALFPAAVQRLLRERCIRAVASRHTEAQFQGTGRTTVAAVFDDVMRQFR